MSTINMNKDIQIEKLCKKLQCVTFDSERDKQNPTLFTEYSGIFTETQLKKLRSFKSGKSTDSTFILNIMRFLYPELSVLNNIPFTDEYDGTIDGHQIFDAMEKRLPAAFCQDWHDHFGYGTIW